jgi:hypothetical protein
MAEIEEQERRIVISLSEARQTSVRYGRARLTVFRFGGLTDGQLGEAIKRFEEGELDAEGLAWAFIGERVDKHTPSFRWEDADLSLLLDRVVAVSTDPKFASSSAGEVAETLVQGAHAEREAVARMRKRTEEWTSGLARQAAFSAGLRPLAESMKRISFATTVDFKGVTGLHPKLHEIAVNGLGHGARAAAALAFPNSATSALGSDYLKKGRWSALQLQPFRHPLLDLSAGGAISKALKAYGQPPGFAGLKGQLLSITESWASFLKESYPENWRDLTSDEVDEVVDLMRESGLCLAWAPRTSILRELLSVEDDEQRTAVLETRSTEIVEDVEAVLGEITSSKLSPTVRASEEAIAAHKDGHTNAALALASAALSNIVHEYFGEKNFKPIRKMFEGVDPRNDVGIRKFVLYTVGRVWVKANERFEGNAGPGFNRNRTLHLLGPHYSESNLLAVLMLLAGLGRELQRFENLEVQQQREDEPAQAAA